MDTEAALEVMAYIAMAITVVGLVAVFFITIPVTVRDLRSWPANSPERVLFKYDLYSALLGAAGLLIMVLIIVVILATDPGTARSLITRPAILFLLLCLTGICVLSPLRRRAIEKSAQRRGSRERGTERR